MIFGGKGKHKDLHIFNKNKAIYRYSYSQKPFYHILPLFLNLWLFDSGELSKNIAIVFFPNEFIFGIAFLIIPMINNQLSFRVSLLNVQKPLGNYNCFYIPF